MGESFEQQVGETTVNVTPYDPEELRTRAWDLDKDGRGTDAIALFSQIVLDHPNTAAALDAQQYLASARALKPTVKSAAPAESVQLVRVVDIDIAFFPMVGLFLKAAIAVIPAAILLGIIWTLISGAVVGVLAGVR